jgi:hypothetical protein
MTTTGRLRVIAAGAAGAGCVLLAADRAYIHLGASLGVAMAGSAASAKTGQAVDRACSSGT